MSKLIEKINEYKGSLLEIGLGVGKIGTFMYYLSELQQTGSSSFAIGNSEFLANLLIFPAAWSLLSGAGDISVGIIRDIPEYPPSKFTFLEKVIYNYLKQVYNDTKCEEKTKGT